MTNRFLSCILLMLKRGADAHLRNHHHSLPTAAESPTGHTSAEMNGRVQVAGSSCIFRYGESFTIGWDSGYGRTNNCVLSFLHAVAVAEKTSKLLFVDPGNWIRKSLEPVYDLENLVQAFSCVRFKAGPPDSIHVRSQDSFEMNFPTSLGYSPEHGRTDRGSAYKVASYQMYSLLYRHVRPSFKAEVSRTLGHVLNRTASDISEAIAKSPILPAEMGYVAIHLRTLMHSCGSSTRLEWPNTGLCDMEPDLVRRIIDEHGAANMPVIIFGKSDEGHIEEITEGLVNELGTSNVYNLVGKGSAMHDELVGEHAALFFGNSGSTFSGMIAYTRLALGRDPETNIGTLEMLAARTRWASSAKKTSNFPDKLHTGISHLSEGNVLIRVPGATAASHPAFWWDTTRASKKIVATVDGNLNHPVVEFG